MRSIRDFKSTVSSEPKDEVGDIAAKYAGRSEEELLQLLRQNVAEAKSDGTFSPEQLESFVRMISPSLDEASRERLVQLVNMISAQ